MSNSPRTTRLALLRDKIAEVLAEVTGREADDVDVRDDASALIALMDGLQVQWLLDRDVIDMAEELKGFLGAFVDVDFSELRVLTDGDTPLEASV